MPAVVMWMPWRYDVSYARHLRSVRFPVYGLATCPPDCQQRVGGRASAGTSTVGSTRRESGAPSRQRNTAPALAELLYERQDLRVAVRTQVSSAWIGMGTWAPPDGTTTTRRIMVEGQTTEFAGVGDGKSWSGRVALGDVVVDVKVEGSVSDEELSLVQVRDFRPALRGEIAWRKRRT